MSNKTSINDKIEASRIAIWNAHEDDIIRTRFEPFGFDEERHLANKVLYAEASALVLKNGNERAGWRVLREEFNTAVKTARNKLSEIRRFLKFWYDATSTEAIELSFYNKKISKYADFKQTAHDFYTVLLGKDEVLAKLVPLGYTTESITTDLGEVNILDKLRNTRELGGGDAQYTTKERNTKLDELDECSAELIRLARLLFKDDEKQYLEKLGISV